MCNERPSFLRLLPLLLVAALANSCDDPPPTAVIDEGDDEPVSGSIQVTTITTGSLLDSDGYAVLVDGQGRWIPTNGAIEIPSVEAGEREVSLDGVQWNCTVSGLNPRTITVLEGETASTSFDVGCEFIAGNIAFVTTRDGASDIYTMDADGSHLLNVTDSPERWDDRPAWSPDGTKLVWSADGDIYSLDLEATLPPKRVTSLGDASDPSWSADGKRIAFNRDNYDWFTNTFVDLGLWIVDADGTNVVRLTASGAQPAWSPVGSRIAFTGDPAGSPDIYVIDADGSNLVRLTVGGGRDPAWSADGSKIAFSTERDGNAEIYVMRDDGSHQDRLTNDAVDDMEPAWSPDGMWITFTKCVGGGCYGFGNMEIYLMDIQGGNALNLSRNDARDWGPSWMPGLKP